MSIRNSRFTALTTGTAIGAMALMLSSPANAIVPNDNFSSEDIVDNEGGVNGVGMFFRNDGFVCSGTLINPRTVLFAAHCVNDRPESDYGTIIRSAFSFDVDALPGFISWISNGFMSFPDQFVYDIAQIQYDPRSLQNPAAAGFLEADIALATLSQPVASELDPLTLSLNATIPTWALLFSPLPSPGEIDPVTGTGYHVNVTGYGGTGSGTLGANEGIDFRRRAAENLLGGLASFDDVVDVVFGPGAPFLPQNLYFIDFDDPARADPRDFNLFRDDALEVEGATAGGDSGGPLVLDAANNDLTDENLQLGVLSGSLSLTGTFDTYGSASFYQPLYLYWDYIAAQNPYRYVTAVEGDGAWEDPDHWVTTLDPVYRIIDDSGAVVNGIPTSPGDGPDGIDPKFGEVCFQSPVFGDPAGIDTTLPTDRCENVATGDTTVDGSSAGVSNNIGQARLSEITSNIGTAPLGDLASQIELSEVADQGDNAADEPAETTTDAEGVIDAGGVEVALANNIGRIDGLGISNDLGTASLDNGSAKADIPVETANGGADTVEARPEGINGGAPEFEDTPNPDPTIDNGLPGATGFVPDNVDPVISADPTQQVDGRYYDVTLANAGTTTLDSEIVIDRLTVSGQAALDIGATGDLTTWIDITQAGGWVNVDGDIGTFGDYLLVTGLLSGNGTVSTPFLTSVMGAIAPGTMGTTGTLTVDGNLVLSSGSMLLIDLGNGAPVPRDGDSDRLVVTGEANLGGTIGFARADGTRPSIGDQYLLITADGGLSDSFDTVTPLSAILYPILTRSPNAIRAWISARTYGNTVDRSNRVARSYADLLDDNRFNPALQSLFDFTDFLPTGEAITDVLASFAPTTEATVQALAASTLTELSAFHNTRLALADRSTNGGTIAMIGSPVQTAALANSAGGTAVQSNVMTAATATAMQAGSRTVADGINEDLAVYLAGGFINGESNAMRTVQNFRDDDFSGYFLAGGVEYYVGESALVGASVYYQDLDADSALANEAESDVIAGTIYGRAEFGRFGIDGQFSIGDYSTDTRRTVRFANVSQTLTSDDSSTLWAAEGGISYEIPGFIGSAVLRPGVDLRYSRINFDTLVEQGGSLALTINRRDYESLQGRAGAEVLTKQDEPFQALFSAHYVYEFLDPANTFQANFAAGTAPFTAPFALGGDDRHWAELGIGLRYNTGNVSFDLSAHTTVERNTVDSQAVTAGVSVRF